MSFRVIQTDLGCHCTEKVRVPVSRGLTFRPRFWVSGLLTPTNQGPDQSSLHLSSSVPFVRTTVTGGIPSSNGRGNPSFLSPVCPRWPSQPGWSVPVFFTEYGALTFTVMYRRIQRLSVVRVKGTGTWFASLRPYLIDLPLKNLSRHISSEDRV